MAEEAALETPAEPAQEVKPQTQVETQIQSAASSAASAAPVVAKPDPEIESLREKARSLDTLVNDNRFREWYAGISAPPKPEPRPQLTPEELMQLQQDPVKYSEYIRKEALEAAKQELMPQIQRQQNEIEVMKRGRDIESTANRHPDFWDLDDKGLIEAQIRKYPGINAEDAYWLAKRGTVEQEVMAKAQETIRKKQGLVVEKPGVQVGSSRVVKVKNKSELFEKAYEYAKKGVSPEDMPDFEVGD